MLPEEGQPAGTHHPGHQPCFLGGMVLQRVGTTPSAQSIKLRRLGGVGPRGTMGEPQAYEPSWGFEPPANRKAVHRLAKQLQASRSVIFLAFQLPGVDWDPNFCPVCLVIVSSSRLSFASLKVYFSVASATAREGRGGHTLGRRPADRAKAVLERAGSA